MFHWIYDAWKEGAERGEEGDPEECRRNSVVGLNEMHLSEVETRFCRPLLPLLLLFLLSSRIPQKPRKSRRKKYGKIENFPIAEEIPPQLAQLAPFPDPERFPLHDKLHGSKLWLVWTVYWKRESQSKVTTLKQNLPRREATRTVSSIVYTRARSRTRTHVPNYSPHPSHATGVTSLPRTTNSLSAPSPPFYKRNPQRKRKEDETQRILTRGKYERISSRTPHHSPLSPSPHPVTSVVFKMFSFLTMKYIPQTAF